MLPRLVQRAGQVVHLQLRRNYGLTAVACAQMDPIQQLFVDKIRDYAKQSKTSGGGLVGATAEVKKSLADELEKIERQFGASGKDFTQFPTFTFKDPVLEAVGIGAEASETSTKPKVAEDVEEREVEEKAYWQV